MFSKFKNNIIMLKIKIIKPETIVKLCLLKNPPNTNNNENNPKANTIK